MNRRTHFAVFPDAMSFLAAARTCSARGLEVVDAWTPWPVHGFEEIAGIRRSRLPWVTLTGGLMGLAGGFWLQYWASAVDWPIDVGGKPWNSFPAFMPVAFELTILSAGLATVFSLIGRSGLRPGRVNQPVIEGVTDDRFALAVARRVDSAEWTPIRELFESHGALRTWEEAQ